MEGRHQAAGGRVSRLAIDDNVFEVCLEVLQRALLKFVQITVAQERENENNLAVAGVADTYCVTCG